MKTLLLLENKTSGQVYDMTPATRQVTWITNRTGSPGVLRFLVHGVGISFFEGDSVRFIVDGQLLFSGWVFTKEKDQDAVLCVTCYDRLRYLTARASYSFYQKTATQILEKIGGDFQLQLGEMAQTGYVLPALIEQNKTCLDIIQGALQQTTWNTGKTFVLYDNGTGLSLVDSGHWVAQGSIGEKDRLIEYKYRTDIHQNTYNKITLGQATGTVGRTLEVTEEDLRNQKKWGVLQLYQWVNMDLNPAQMKAQAQALLNQHNRRVRTLWVRSVGLVGVRAGMSLKMTVPDLGDIHLDQYVVLDRVTHTFEQDLHLMEFETLPI